MSTRNYIKIKNLKIVINDRKIKISFIKKDEKTRGVRIVKLK